MCNLCVPGCLTLLRAITNNAVAYADRYEKPARASMDLARLCHKLSSLACLSARLAQQITMRTLLVAALVGLCANGAAAQDDNAITDMISNPILCVSAAHD